MPDISKHITSPLVDLATTVANSITIQNGIIDILSLNSCDELSLIDIQDLFISKGNVKKLTFSKLNLENIKNIFFINFFLDG